MEDQRVNEYTYVYEYGKDIDRRHRIFGSYKFCYSIYRWFYKCKAPNYPEAKDGLYMQCTECGHRFFFDIHDYRLLDKYKKVNTIRL